MSARQCAVFVALLACFGCASLQPVVLNESVGPLGEPVAGSLIVYTDIVGQDSEPSDYHHSDYRLLSASGQLIQTVKNGAAGAREPAVVRLAPGRYAVLAFAPQLGWVNVPVVIEAHRTTVVDLNGEVLPASLAGEKQWVRLPNGRAVGSKAN